MAIVTVELPEPLQAYAEKQASEYGYRDVAEWVRSLLESERQSRSPAEVEALLLDAVDGPFAPWSSADLDDVARRGDEIIGRKMGR